MTSSALPVPPAAAPDSAALVDLLGALAYGQLSAFDRLADDARLAPTLAGRVRMSCMAGAQMANFTRLAQRLDEVGTSVDEAMEPFVAALESFHALTTPSTWLEGVVKAYVGEGLAGDFYREVAARVDPGTRALIDEVVTEGDRAQFAVDEVRAAVAVQPAVAGRLALWARRLVGEAISQTQYVLADRDSLLRLLVGDADFAGVAAVGGLLGRIIERHEARMHALGLD